jgi:hypothetical protein
MIVAIYYCGLLAAFTLYLFPSAYVLRKLSKCEAITHGRSTCLLDLPSQVVKQLLDTVRRFCRRLSIERPDLLSKLLRLLIRLRSFRVNQVLLIPSDGDFYVLYAAYKFLMPLL